VDVAAGVARLLGHLVDDANDRITNQIGFGFEFGKIDRGWVCGFSDRGGGIGGDQTESGLDIGEGDFNLDVARNGGLIGEDGAHGVGAESIAENG
jgi:hypothetical protein